MRQRFVSRNSRGAADIDFDGFPNRQNQDQGRKLIRGSGAAKNWNELQDLTYPQWPSAVGRLLGFGRRCAYERA